MTERPAPPPESGMGPDLWLLYRMMLYSRLFEERVAELWRRGLILGQMHLGLGEEGIVAGVVSRLQEGDAMALDHRGTPALLMRGVNPVSLLREFLGRPDGLCRGRGGHMHLFVPELLAASSGIVGASSPTGAGFALAAQHLRPGKVAVAFFGEGAFNEGMLLETLNLAVAWRLPLLLICKDNAWSVTTSSPSVTGGSVVDRARAFGMPGEEVDGSDVLAMAHAAAIALSHIRSGGGPWLLLARCIHPEGHFLGDPFIAAARDPVHRMFPVLPPLIRALVNRRGAPLRDRLRAMMDIMTRPVRARRAIDRRLDPVARARLQLSYDAERLRDLESLLRAEVSAIVDVALAGTTEGPA